MLVKGRKSLWEVVVDLEKEEVSVTRRGGQVFKGCRGTPPRASVNLSVLASL